MRVVECPLLLTQLLASIINSHLQPDRPATPLILSRPAASSDERMSAMLIAVQKKPSRMESSWCL